MHTKSLLYKIESVLFRAAGNFKELLITTQANVNTHTILIWGGSKGGLDASVEPPK